MRENRREKEEDREMREKRDEGEVQKRKGRHR